MLVEHPSPDRRPAPSPTGIDLAAVCITRSSKAPAPVRIEQRNGLDLAWWRDAAYTYVIVGVVAPDEAKILADRVDNALRS
jgi:hypothetical protein